MDKEDKSKINKELENMRHSLKRKRDREYYQKNKERIRKKRNTPEYKKKKKEWDRLYFEKNKEKIYKRQREYEKYKRATDKEYLKRERENNRKSYEKHREKNIKRVMDYKKKNNYKSEKTEKQRRLRYIKRRTREIYPLEGHNCEICGIKAQVRHHNTEPIEIDKFNYLCNKCHKEVHRNDNNRKLTN